MNSKLIENHSRSPHEIFTVKSLQNHNSKSLWLCAQKSPGMRRWDQGEAGIESENANCWRKRQVLSPDRFPCIGCLQVPLLDSACKIKLLKVTESMCQVSISRFSCRRHNSTSRSPLFVVSWVLLKGSGRLKVLKKCSSEKLFKKCP